MCREQAELRSKLFEADSANVLSWNADEDKYKNLVRVGGVDISFQKDDQNFACAMLVVLSFPDLKVQAQYTLPIGLISNGIIATPYSGHLCVTD